MDRRLLLSIIAGTIVLPGMARAVPAPPPPGRVLRLVNPHTGETFDGPYRDDVGPIPAAMENLSVFLRDFHVNETINYDVEVIDFLAAVMDATGETEATILSAYRTRETNEVLARTTFGVAENSQHIYGRALDVHFGAKLLILDEPTAALGVKEAAHVLRIVLQARQKGIAVVFITHNVIHALTVGDHFAVLIHGSKAADFRKGEKSREEITDLMAGGEQMAELEAEIESYMVTSEGNPEPARQAL